MANGKDLTRQPPHEVDENQTLLPKTTNSISYSEILQNRNTTFHSKAAAPSFAQPFKPFSVDYATTLKGNIQSNLVFGDFVSNKSCTLKPIIEYCGKKAILFQKSDKLRLINKITHVLIGKFSHGRPLMSDIKDFFIFLKLKGSYNISFFDSKHIYIECELFQDFITIWLEKIWIVKGFQMRVFKWSVDFNPKQESPVVTAWIHLYGLPLYLFEKEALMSIANAIGNPLYVSRNNLNRSNLSYASLCVELDVTKPLLDEVWIEFGKEKWDTKEQTEEKKDGFWQTLSYGSIPSYCVFCFHIGHSWESCKQRNKKGPGEYLGVRCKDFVDKDPRMQVTGVQYLGVQSDGVQSTGLISGGQMDTSCSNNTAQQQTPIEGSFSGAKEVQRSVQGLQDGSSLQEPCQARKCSCSHDLLGKQKCVEMTDPNMLQNSCDHSVQTAAKIQQTSCELCNVDGSCCRQPVVQQECVFQNQVEVKVLVVQPAESGQVLVEDLTLEDGEIAVKNDGKHPVGEPDTGLLARVRKCAAAGDQFPPEREQNGVQEMQLLQEYVQTVSQAGADFSTETAGLSAGTASTTVAAEAIGSAGAAGHIGTAGNIGAAGPAVTDIGDAGVAGTVSAAAADGAKGAAGAAGSDMESADAGRTELVSTAEQTDTAAGRTEGLSTTEQDHEQQLAREQNAILEWDATKVKAFIHKQIEDIKQEIGQTELKIRDAAKEEKKKELKIREEKQLARELKFVHARKNLKEYFMASAEKINSDLERKRSEKMEKTTGISFKYREG